jgi:uncharacterized membrane protein YphA (DoxX/SURF4 family)
MLSFFPELFDWSWYVPFAFRLFLAYYLIKTGWGFTRSGDPDHERDKFVWASWGAILIALGGMFLVGLATQVVAAVGFVVALFAAETKQFHLHYERYVPESFTFYFLLALVSLSLVFLGPGPYAFDLPL